jgi:hypothetical protein
LVTTLAALAIGAGATSATFFATATVALTTGATVAWTAFTTGLATATTALPTLVSVFLIELRNPAVLISVATVSCSPAVTATCATGPAGRSLGVNGARKSITIDTTSIQRMPGTFIWTT